MSLSIHESGSRTGDNLIVPYIQRVLVTNVSNLSGLQVQRFADVERMFITYKRAYEHEKIPRIIFPIKFSDVTQIKQIYDFKLINSGRFSNKAYEHALVRAHVIKCIKPSILNSDVSKITSLNDLRFAEYMKFTQLLAAAVEFGNNILSDVPVSPEDVQEVKTKRIVLNNIMNDELNQLVNEIQNPNVPYEVRNFIITNFVERKISSRSQIPGGLLDAPLLDY